MTAAAMLSSSLYVYYRVWPAALDDTVAAVRAMQAALRARHPDLQAQVLRRVEVPAVAPDAATALPYVTLMEVYAAPSGASEALLVEIETLAAALPAAVRMSARHLERFEPCG